MNGQVSILIIGSEILDGRVYDANSHFLEQELKALGLQTVQVLTCDDAVDVIVESLKFLLERSSVVITSGGLGPTSDDLAREAVSKLAGKDLKLEPQRLLHLRELYRQRQRPFEKINEKQACFPEGAEILPNPAGIAPAFAVRLQEDGQSKLICALPGVPRELDAIFTGSIKPLLQREFGVALRRQSLSLWIFGRTEAAVAQAVENCGLDPRIITAYRIAFPEVQAVFSGDDPRLLEQARNQAAAAVGREFIVSEEPGLRLEQVVHNLLCAQGLTISVAESCTGGMLGELLTASSGASKYFTGGVIGYSNSVKQALLGVEEKVLMEHGAVSSKTAALMASGAKSLFKTDLALSITGIAGPQGGSPDKPLGTFYVGLAAGEEATAFHFHWAGERERVRRYGAYTALDVLRRKLLGLGIRTCAV